MKLTNLDRTKHWYGFLLSLTTAILWGVLPVFLTLSLEKMDAITITLYRFFVAGVFVFFVLWKHQSLPRLAALAGRKGTLLFVASLFLVVNYVSNVKGLEYLNPETAQIVMQIAPFMLMLGGVVFFKERLTRLEICGALLLFSGLMLFFNDRLADLFLSVSQFSVGVFVILLAATTWAAYALMQKTLLRSLTAKQLTLSIYIIGFCVLLPFSRVSLLMDMQMIHVLALLFCCANTIVAYGAFTEALNIWPASKVSAVLAMSPIFTFLSMTVAVKWLPGHFTASNLDYWAYIGAAVVIAGSALTALGRPKQR
ncbi:DMT family transporter [uncultured Paraglaciecola sp.]|uniref:DMT family transporter n=1 Tax=uncultured Paraglaciecola sp. TaxID=1765024 RepID=UPI00260E68E0|nr:DMT family transporter [uncultured Paraglaciecola sp.]